MAKLSLCEITQSQLNSTPVKDGQIICCLDTGNFYRDTATSRVHLGHEFEPVEALPLAPIANKIYLLRPDELYIYNEGWVLLNTKSYKIKATASAANGAVKLSVEGSSDDSGTKLSGSGLVSVTSDSNGNITVATTAEKNQNAFANIKVGGSTVAADSATDTVEFVAGNNVTITADAGNDKVMISAKDVEIMTSAEIDSICV